LSFGGSFCGLPFLRPAPAGRGIPLTNGMWCHLSTV
jgi:hypothetical protein